MSVEKLKDQLGNSLSKLRGRPTVSFEFFPPKDEAMEQDAVGISASASRRCSRASCP